MDRTCPCIACRERVTSRLPWSLRVPALLSHIRRFLTQTRPTIEAARLISRKDGSMRRVLPVLLVGLVCAGAAAAQGLLIPADKALEPLAMVQRKFTDF